MLKTTIKAATAWEKGSIPEKGYRIFTGIGGFLDSSINITTAVMTLAFEKLYDDYDLEIGNEVVITKKKSLAPAP